MPDEFQAEPGFEGIIGTSPELKLALALAQSAAVSDNPVFILGETGSGKKLIARAIHQSSARWNNAFIRIDCAAALPKLLEMELFGHETNPLEGGSGEKSGHLELADKGTLFLDEIADLPLDLQHRLLRVLERREFERPRGGRTFRVNLRWIAASRHDLRQRDQAITLIAPRTGLPPPQWVKWRFYNTCVGQDAGSTNSGHVEQVPLVTAEQRDRYKQLSVLRQLVFLSVPPYKLPRQIVCDTDCNVPDQKLSSNHTLELEVTPKRAR